LESKLYLPFHKNPNEKHEFYLFDLFALGLLEVRVDEHGQPWRSGVEIATNR